MTFTIIVFAVIILFSFTNMLTGYFLIKKEKFNMIVDYITMFSVSVILLVVQIMATIFVGFDFSDFMCKFFYVLTLILIFAFPFFTIVFFKCINIMKKIEGKKETYNENYSGK